MKRKWPNLISLIAVVALAGCAREAEMHVAIDGDDANPGTARAPLRTIGRAAERARPGDTITVHAGVYRERVNPPRGGTSDRARIVYRAAPGEKVEIRGSEEIKDWARVKGDVWSVTIPNTFFGNFNPYADLIRGDWFNPKGRGHHTGAVYLNGEWLIEAATLEDVLAGKRGVATSGPFAVPEAPLWFGRVDATNTTIWAQFPGADPNQQLVEINVRQTVFYPDKPGRNYITVRGFTMRHAATPWAPPTAEQPGLIGTHWSKGWVIEDNVVSHSICSGIALGKHGDEFDNTSANSAEGYVKTIERAHAHPIAWTKENIGGHIVRNNTVSHCEQAGIVGSLGCSFSTVTGNVIHDIHVRRLFTGAEMAGIKFHAAIDTEISRNHIYRTTRGLWLDWMAQGTRVTRNLFHDNISEDLFVEVNHGPFLVDNNIFLSPTTLLDMSQGGAYAHNLIAGKIVSAEEPGRETPFHPEHSTRVAGLANIKGGDNRFYNNIFVGDGSPATPPAPPKQGERHRRVAGYGLFVYDGREFPLMTGGNVYYRGARPYAKEDAPTAVGEFDPRVRLEGLSLQLTLDPAIQKAKAQTVTTELLGAAKIPGAAYKNPDGSPVRIDGDYFGKNRDVSHPTPGPIERPGLGEVQLKVW